MSPDPAAPGLILFGSDPRGTEPGGGTIEAGQDLGDVRTPAHENRSRLRISARRKKTSNCGLAEAGQPLDKMVGSRGWWREPRRFPRCQQRRPGRAGGVSAFATRSRLRSIEQESTEYRGPEHDRSPAFASASAVQGHPPEVWRGHDARLRAIAAGAVSDALGVLHRSISMRACWALSSVHDLNRERKLWPRSGSLATGPMLAVTLARR